MFFTLGFSFLHFFVYNIFWFILLIFNIIQTDFGLIIDGIWSRNNRICRLPSCQMEFHLIGFWWGLVQLGIFSDRCCSLRMSSRMRPLHFCPWRWAVWSVTESLFETSLQRDIFVCPSSGCAGHRLRSHGWASLFYGRTMQISQWGVGCLKDCLLQGHLRCTHRQLGFHQGQVTIWFWLKINLFGTNVMLDQLLLN